MAAPEGALRVYIPEPLAHPPLGRSPRICIFNTPLSDSFSSQGWYLLPSCPADPILVELRFWPKGCNKHLSSKSFTEAAGIAGSLHGSGFRTTSSLASRPLGDSLPQPVSFSPIVRAQLALPILPARFPHQFPPRSASHGFLLHMVWLRLQQGYDHPECLSQQPLQVPLIKQGMFFLPPGFISPSVPSSSTRPDVSDTYSRFLSKSFRT